MFKLLFISWSIFTANPVEAVQQPAVDEVLRIAKAIAVVQPYLDNSKYIEYALGIRRASLKYGVEPQVLIAITQQESGFREKLPEGAAGEIGISQILKSWLDNARFKMEFGVVTTADLKKPAKSFLYSAWILRNLKAEVTSRTLPYWSFYNSQKFESRLKYFLRVNKHIAVLRKRFPSFYAYGMRDVTPLAQVPPVAKPQVSTTQVRTAATRSFASSLKPSTASFE